MEYKINTSIPIQFELLEEISDSRFQKVKVWLCHTEGNLNGSYFSKQLLEKMKDESLANIPILGYISVDSLNESDFNGHEERIIIDSNGIRLEYVGKIYGLIPETNNAKFEFKLCDDGIEREFLTCEGLLYTRFNECIDIFNRDESKGQSMELERESISGSMEKDGLFHFSTAKFEGACILGSSFIPAMTGSVIEKFSVSSVKAQLQEMIEELKVTFSKLDTSTPDVDNINNNQEGGKKQLEKFELIKKYPNLTEEDISDLKINHEKYSIEEFDMKLKELSDAKNLPKTDFTLTAEQLNEEVRKVLRTRKIIAEDWWGDEYSENEFYYRDIKDNLVIVIDNAWENYYGIPFTTSGDTVTIDFDNKVPYMYDWRPRTDGDVVTNFAKQEFEEKLKAFSDKAVKKAKDETVAEYEAKITEFNTTIGNLNSEITQLSTTNTSLLDFKTKTETAQLEAFENQQKELKAELVENFSKVLSAEEVKSVEDKNLSADDMEKEFKLMFASKELSTKFTKKVKPEKIVAPVINTDGEEVKNARYGKYEKFIENK